MKTRVIAIMNQKGGVAKTTSAINLGAALSKLGKKVLLIDLDAQANLSIGLGIHEESFDKSIYDIITSAIQKKDISIQDYIIPKHGIDVIPSDIRLARIDSEITSVINSQGILKRAFKDKFGDYDYVLIDCLPSLGLLAINALVLAQEVLIPINPEVFSTKGLKDMRDTIQIVKDELNAELKIAGVFITKSKNVVIHKNAIETVREAFTNEVFNTQIREAIEIVEAQSMEQPIFEYKPDGKGAEDYTNLAKELANKE